MRKFASQLSCNLQPVHTRQPDIQDDNVGEKPPRHVQPAAALVRRIHFVTKRLQEQFQRLRQIDIIVDNENPSRGNGEPFPFMLLARADPRGPR